MANIYVRKSGNDSNNGSTPALAKLTITGAISAMTSGDTIYIGSGIYREQSINGGSKHITIIGDITGENTGDAGEIIWSGLNSTDDTYTAVSYAITNTASYNLYIYNIIFENWKLSNGGYCIYKSNSSNLTVDNCEFKNIIGYDTTSFGIVYYQSSSTNKVLSLTNILVDGMNFQTSNQMINKLFDLSQSDVQGSFTAIILKNIIIKNGTFISTNTSSNVVRCIYISCNNSLVDIENINIDNIFQYSVSTSGNANLFGIDFFTKLNSPFYNCNVSNLMILSPSGSCSSTALFSNYYDSYAYNCNAFNILKNGSAGTNFNVAHTSNCIEKSNYTIPKTEKISRFSPLKGVGHTTFPTTDIEGNPRPAYGNGAACDIGAIESTSDIIQKESTIKDSGDYSIKVSPCNYFKKVFQVPVEATKLRTVKAKIRIDGTWGTTRPKITLSGQGMTASSATKNSTTGSFEELTVSGTPTTTGIALLTIEAHSANTDAAFYIDTITIE